MISDLISSFEEAGVELDAESIADSLWLARVQNTFAPATEPSRERTATASRPSEARPPDVDKAESNAQRPTSLDERSRTADDVARGGGEADAQPSVVRIMAPPALPGRLELGRALRPFNRRCASTRVSVLDEEATVQYFCETNVMNPVLTPAAERWFDVDLMVETSTSMLVWHDTAREFGDLLERHGAFRSVRRWNLTAANDDSIVLVSRESLHHQPSEFVDPDGRRLILVMTDCVSALWDRDPIWIAIRQWGRFTPVAIVNTLPARLWPRTALGAADVSMRSHRPGAPNGQLDADLPWWMEESTPSLALPVVTLDSDRVSGWARVIMGGAGVQTSGVMVDEELGREAVARSAAAQPAPDDISPSDRVVQFRVTVSAEAYQLSVYLAASVRGAWSLPLARVVQRVMMPTSDPSHLAEVVVGGLIAPADEHDGHPTFRFLEGVAPVLTRSLTGSESLRLIGALSRYVETFDDGEAEFSALLLQNQETIDVAPGLGGLAAAVVDLVDAFDLRGTEVARSQRTTQAAPPTERRSEHQERPESEQPNVMERSEGSELADLDLVARIQTADGALVDGVLPPRSRLLLELWLAAGVSDGPGSEFGPEPVEPVPRSGAETTLTITVRSGLWPDGMQEAVVLIPTDRQREVSTKASFEFDTPESGDVVEFGIVVLHRQRPVREATLTAMVRDVALPSDQPPRLTHGERPVDPVDASNARRDESGQLSIEMLPARDGTSLLIRYGNARDPHRILFDCGPKGSGASDRLRSEPGRIDLLVLSHIDNNNIGDAVELLDNRELEIGDVWFNGYRHIAGEANLL